MAGQSDKENTFYLISLNNFCDATSLRKIRQTTIFSKNNMVQSIYLFY